MGTELRTDTLTPAEALAALRAQRPLTQCLTNSVVTGFTANVLLALGATPAMVDIPEESGAFAVIADGVLINLGTPRQEQREAILEAASSTNRWVLDPVAIGSLRVRTELAATLLDRGPAIIRGNASEIIAAAGAGTGGRGTDTTVESTDAIEVARSLAISTGAIVAVSGEVDVVTDGTRVIRVSGGSALLTLVTGGGCSFGATMAAFLGVCSPLSAAVAASAVYVAASERAAASASGPGTFAVDLLDQLAAITPSDLDGVAVDTRDAIAVAAS